jgi:hypothetical protein
MPGRLGPWSEYDPDRVIFRHVRERLKVHVCQFSRDTLDPLLDVR